MANTKEELQEIATELQYLANRLRSASSTCMRGIEYMDTDLYTLRKIDMDAIRLDIQSIGIKINRLRDHHGLLNKEILDAEFLAQEEEMSES